MLFLAMMCIPFICIFVVWSDFRCFLSCDLIVAILCILIPRVISLSAQSLGGGFHIYIYSFDVTSAQRGVHSVGPCRT